MFIYIYAFTNIIKGIYRKKSTKLVYNSSNKQSIIIIYSKRRMKVAMSGVMTSCSYFQAIKSRGLLNPPFLFMYCLEKKKKKTHYITVTLATLADYIIEHQ